MDSQTSPDTTGSSAYLGLTAEIVAAYVAHNSLSAADLPKLITDVHGAMKAIGAGAAAEPEEAEQKPAVPIRKSVTPDFIVCLEDGLKFKSLKRHLATHFSMTPDQYRAKWGLPDDYPMVAPNYSARRSALAKDNGLGTKSVGGRRKAA